MLKRFGPLLSPADDANAPAATPAAAPAAAPADGGVPAAAAPAAASFSEEQVRGMMDSYRQQIVDELKPHFESQAEREKTMHEKIGEAFGFRKKEPLTPEALEARFNKELQSRDTQIEQLRIQAQHRELSRQIDSEMAPVREEFKGAFSYPGFEEHLYRVVAKDVEKTGKVRPISEIAREEVAKLTSARDAEFAALGGTIPAPAAGGKGPTVVKPGGGVAPAAKKKGESISDMVARHLGTTH